MKKNKKSTSVFNPVVLGASIILPLGSLIPLSILAWRYFKSSKGNDDIDYSE